MARVATKVNSRPPRRTKATAPVRKGLKGFADARKTSGALLKEIQTHVVEQAAIHGQDGREQHKVHVSELAKKDWCPRQSTYKLSHTEPSDPGRTPNHRLEVIWATGHDAHAKWQRWLREMGNLEGTWECLLCGHRWFGTSPKTCPGSSVGFSEGSEESIESCGGTQLKYLEVELEDIDFKIVGHADAGLDERLVEVKSFAPGTVRIEAPDLVRRATVKTENGGTIVDEAALWKSLVRPLRSHLLQGMLYLWMAKRMGMAYKSIVFIYEWKANQATKEFVVKASDILIQPILDTMTQVLEHVEAGTVPDRPEGFELDKRPCSECVFRSKCWEKRGDEEDQEAPRVPTRRRVIRRQTSAGEATDLPPTEAEPSVSADPRRPDRTRRPRVDADVHPVDEVGRVHGDPVGVRGGRRAARRISR